MASFFKRGKTWYYSIDIGKDAEGKRKKDSKGGFRTKQEAKDAVALITTDLADGTYIAEKSTTFAKFADDWLKWYTPQVKESTVCIRKKVIKTLKKYFTDELRDVSRKQYQEVLLELHQIYAENSVTAIHSTARMIFKKAIEWEALKRDPTEFAKVTRKKASLDDVDELPNYLEKADLSRFLKTARITGIDDDYPIFLLLSYTGMRIGELCALKWSDVDFAEKTIRITKTLFSEGNVTDYKLYPPKTLTSRRTIEVDLVVIKEIENHQARQNIAHMKNRDKWLQEEFIFTSRKYPGYPLYNRNIQQKMNRIVKAAGLSENLTPHSLRHTHTSLLAEAGVGLEEIMERLGHCDDKTTRKVYLHVTAEMKKQAVHKFSELMKDL